MSKNFLFFSIYLFERRNTVAHSYLGTESKKNQEITEKATETGKEVKKIEKR